MERACAAERHQVEAAVVEAAVGAQEPHCVCHVLARDVDDRVGSYVDRAPELRVDRRLTRVLRSDRATDTELRDAVSRIASEALDELRAEGGDGADPTLVVTASARYLGQNFEQEVVVPLDAHDDLVEVLVERFHQQHEAIYEYRLPEAVVELVHLNATAIERRVPARSAPLAPGVAEPVGVRPVSFEAGRR